MTDSTAGAKSILLAGTSSNVGKSVLATALCRIFYQDGFRVAPFKAQNMSLNSAATPCGREIGRAQAVQAEACGIEPNEHMNPVLLKPSGPSTSQVVLQGRVYGTQSAAAYMRDAKREIWQAVVESFRFLQERFEVIVMEGAGSPVEMNLKARDIANLRAAEMADAVVYLVADIDRGGVFASVVGTLQLLTPEERARVQGIIINKFRGDPDLFKDGVTLMEAYTGVPVLGVIPFLPDLGIDEEDSLALASERYRRPAPSPDRGDAGGDELPIAMIQLPHLANFTDVDPLFLEPGVRPYFCKRPEELAGAHAIVLPGTKNTMRDLTWLRAQGWLAALESARRRGVFILAICGGYQMLGQAVHDEHHLESDVDVQAGLGWIPAVTHLAAEKRTVLVRGRLQGPYAGISVEGYEIHMGVTTFAGPHTPFAVLSEPSANQQDGVVLEAGKVIGTYLHGIFHNDAFRHAWLQGIREAAGLAEAPGAVSVRDVRTAAYDRLAAVVRKHLDMDTVYRHLQLVPRKA
ncbi:cobyric acid synthase [Alicyclobacillus cycloheptanicus]|uniref:Cobyric acid synthase n=1 Tax=Alicyclobacillus cycloheptanicus TaxID=1457 RepID=A0ABT9XF68_9BACL|nr:cobyric acid synthase [Alicyclobacillus cycloheptanicus]MDQ0188948.1 adenosylcobyric acid synthase [Alicyclobacillus cycloheptanicus]WDM01703.1 cobyric acid synthase [Alicyclobacillus cycloheptanicus]